MLVVHVMPRTNKNRFFFSGLAEKKKRTRTSNLFVAHLLRACHPRFCTTFRLPPPAAAPFLPAAEMEEAVAIPPGMIASVPTPAWLLKYACAPTGTAENASVRG